MISDPCRTVMPKAKKKNHMVLNPLYIKEIASGTLCLYILKGQKALVFFLGIFKDRISK